MFRTCATVLALAAVASATKSLSLSVSAPAHLDDVSALEVVTTFTNTGDETLKLLRDPRTALSSWATETFDVTNDAGVAPDFTGVLVRYIPEVAAKSGAADAFTIIAPGQSIDVTHEVGNYYNFTSAGAGTFKFKPLNTFKVVEADGTLSSITATTSHAAVKLAGKLSSSGSLSRSSLGGSVDMRRSYSGGLEKRASYRSTCTSAYQTKNNAAITAASTLASKSVTHLTANPSGSTLQTTWYGTFASARYSKSLASFKTLVSAPASWTYDCSCTDSTLYAYVYPSTYGVVYLCGYYWNAPATGSGSRADTIIHEGTHFPTVLGTDDYAYGETACKSLAKSNPANAVNNADNQAFFSDYV